MLATTSVLLLAVGLTMVTIVTMAGASLDRPAQLLLLVAGALGLMLSQRLSRKLEDPRRD